MEQDVEKLIIQLQDQNEDVRRDAIVALGKFESRDVVPFLIPLVQDQIGMVRNAVIRTLGRIEKGVEDAVSYLIPLLQDKDFRVRRNTVRVLGEFTLSFPPKTRYFDSKKNVKNIISALVELLQDKNGNCRAHVSEAICRIGKVDIIDIVIPMLQDTDPLVRSRTAYALGEIGPGAKDADIYLIHTLKDPDERVRKDAEWALGKINTPDARRALRYE